MSEKSHKARSFWKRLIGHYGAPAVEQKFGLDPPPDWCSAIDRMEQPHIERALSICKTQYPNYVPTLGQFAQAARPPERPLAGKGPSLLEQLQKFVACRYHPRNGVHPVTDKQFTLTWINKFRDVRQFDSEGREITVPQIAAIEIPQRDGVRGYLITVEDMQMAGGV